MKKVMMICVCCSLAFAGCQTLPGGVQVSVSQFDGTKQIMMEPAWLYDSYIKLGLFKNSKMDKDEVELIATVKGAHGFAGEESLHINIDGDIINLASLDELTDIETSEGLFVGGYSPDIS